MPRCCRVHLRRTAPRRPTWKTVQWRVTNLGSLPGEERSVATAINNSGDIVGFSMSGAANRQHPFLVRQGKMAPLLSPVRDASVQPALVSNGGAVAGYIYQPQARDPGRAFLYMNGSFRMVGNAGGANGLNDRGEMVGNQTTWTLVEGRPGNVRQSAWRYYQGRMTDLTAQLGVLSANGINRHGHIVGETADARAYVWRDGRLTVIGALGQDRYSRAIAINGAGVVAGVSFREQPETWSLAFSRTLPEGARAFVHADGKLTDLNALGSFDASIAWAVNEAGQVLGEAVRGTTRFSFLYHNGKFIDLTALPALAEAGWSGVTLNGINDHGQLVGSGQIGGRESAVLISPGGG